MPDNQQTDKQGKILYLDAHGEKIIKRDPVLVKMRSQGGKGKRNYHDQQI
jgi:hypothetical protein